MDTIGRHVGFVAEKAMAMTESPIEKVLAIHLAQVVIIGREIWPIHIGAMPSWATGGFAGEAFCIPQANLPPYRADFLFVRYGKDNLPDRHVIVECDGHDFHERTKAQAQRDKERDRFFTKKGWHVLRYTGSEIWARPSDIVVEILNFVFEIDPA